MTADERRCPGRGGTLRIEFSATDVARTRFAISPLWEVVTSVRVLKGADHQRLHQWWAEQVRPVLAASTLDLSPLTSLVPVPTVSIPGFLVPPPTAPQPSLEVELAALRATPREEIRTTDARLRAPVAAIRADPDRGLGRLVEVIAAYWEMALAPYWPRMVTLFEGDVSHRARLFAEGGAGVLFEDLAAQLSWDSGVLRLPHLHTRGPRRLNGRGLLLVPSAFVGPRIFSTLADDERLPTLRYAPRGVGNLWAQRPQRYSDALAGVLGRSRARLLAELSAPTSTTRLANRIGLTPGGVSQHLTALRAAGLVSAHRTGREVWYARTGVAEALLAGCAEPPGAR